MLSLSFSAWLDTDMIVRPSRSAIRFEGMPASARRWSVAVSSGVQGLRALGRRGLDMRPTLDGSHRSGKSRLGTPRSPKVRLLPLRRARRPKAWTGAAAVADASLNRRMTVRIGGSVAFAHTGIAGMDGRLEPEARHLPPPEAYRSVEIQAVRVAAARGRACPPSPGNPTRHRTWDPCASALLATASARTTVHRRMRRDAGKHVVGWQAPRPRSVPGVFRGARNGGGAGARPARRRRGRRGDDAR